MEGPGAMGAEFKAIRADGEQAAFAAQDAAMHQQEEGADLTEAGGPMDGELDGGAGGSVSDIVVEQDAAGAQIHGDATGVAGWIALVQDTVADVKLRIEPRLRAAVGVSGRSGRP